MKRLLLLGMSLFCLLFAQPPSAHAEDFVPADVEKSIVWVETTWKASVWAPGAWFDDGTPGYFKGMPEVTFGCTGWFVSDVGDVITAGHCVTFDESVQSALIDDLLVLTGYDSSKKLVKWAHEDWRVYKKETTRKVFVGQALGTNGPLEDDYLAAQVVASQSFENGDNALLRVAGITSEGLAISSVTPGIGDDVTAIGFPGSVTDVSDIRRQRPSFKEGSVSSFQFSDNGVPNTEIDAVVSSGMSGGPTVDVEGAVIGVNSFGVLGETQSINFVTDAETLRRFVTSKGVTPVVAETSTITPTPTEETSETPSTDSSETPSSESASPSPESASPEREATEKSGSNWMLYALIAAGVLVLILLLLLLLSRRKKPAQQAPMREQVRHDSPPTQQFQQQSPPDHNPDENPRQ